MDEIINHTNDDDVEIDTENEFYFESDNLALRGHPDYTKVLRTLVILESQRKQALIDLEKLSKLQQNALENPLEFVKNISNPTTAYEFPTQLKIADIPNINLEKYNVCFPNIPATTNNNNKEKNDKTTNIFLDENRTNTHNLPWTFEEQRRLEDLLIEYPPEQFEMRRFAKISRALGNRTTKQVASRVQKFFIKLHSVGMPIPGRIPKNQRTNSRYRYNKLTFRTSSFFPAHDVPVKIPEDNNDIYLETSLSSSNLMKSTTTNETDMNNVIGHTIYIPIDDDSDDDSELEQRQTMSSKVRATNLLSRVRKDKNNNKNNDEQSIHLGFKCNNCLDSPIKGTRWNCRTCQIDTINYCSDCFIINILSNDNNHSIFHRFTGLRASNIIDDIDSTKSNHPSEDDDVSKSFSSNNKIKHNDKNYTLNNFTKSDDYNYLDPNFSS